MRLDRLLAALLAAALMVASVTALAKEGRGTESAPGLERHSGGSDGPGSGNRSGGAADDGEDDDEDNATDEHHGPGPGIAELAREQQEEQEEFRAEMAEREAECRAEENASERSECLRELAEERREFQREQHEEFQEALEELREAPAEERLGRFNITGASVQGRFVSFTLDAAACALRSVTIQGVLVLDEVSIAGAGPADELELDNEHHGAVFEMECGDGEIKLHDNPAAVLKAEAGDAGSTRWDIAAGIEVNATHADDDEDAEGNASDKLFLRLTAGNFSALLRLEGASEAGGAWMADEGHLVAHGPNVLVPGAANRHRGDIERAKEHGHVGAEVSVIEGDEAPVADVLVLDDMALNVSAGGAGGVRVVVNATGVGGKTIVVNVAQGLLRGDRVVVTFFDEVNGTFHEVPITEAQGGLADVLDPTDDSGPEFWVVHDQDGAQVLLSIPHFSTKAFVIQGLAAELVPSVVAGALAAVLFVAAAGAGLLRKRRP